MQPIHATSDMPWVQTRVGSRRLVGAYAWRTILNSGVHICFGSDFPEGSPDVTHGLHAAVTRQDESGQPEGGWHPDQKLELQEALRAYSAEAARAARRDAHLGVLREGYQADLTCFAQDIFSLSPPELRAAKILATIVRGEVVHRA
jgi:predicted amidohydrolase YtcJ